MSCVICMSALCTCVKELKENTKKLGKAIETYEENKNLILNDLSDLRESMENFYKESIKFKERELEEEYERKLNDFNNSFLRQYLEITELKAENEMLKAKLAQIQQILQPQTELTTQIEIPTNKN